MNYLVRNDGDVLQVVEDYFASKGPFGHHEQHLAYQVYDIFHEHEVLVIADYQIYL